MFRNTKIRSRRLSPPPQILVLWVLKINVIVKRYTQWSQLFDV